MVISSHLCVWTYSVLGIIGNASAHRQINFIDLYCLAKSATTVELTKVHVFIGRIQLLTKDYSMAWTSNRAKIYGWLLFGVVATCAYYTVPGKSLLCHLYNQNDGDRDRKKERKIKRQKQRKNVRFLWHRWYLSSSLPIRKTVWPSPCAFSHIHCITSDNSLPGATTLWYIHHTFYALWHCVGCSHSISICNTHIYGDIFFRGLLLDQTHLWSWSGSRDERVQYTAVNKKDRHFIGSYIKYSELLKLDKEWAKKEKIHNSRISQSCQH